MATEESAHAAQVSEAFVEQYYHIIGTMPKEARKFYLDASVVSRPGPDGTMMSFTSVEAINEHFLSYEYEGTAFDVLSVDSQNSLEDGVFIVVIGFLTLKDNLRRKFSQMFYLARQSTTYVVINDIFRFVDEQSSAPIAPLAVEPPPEADTAKPVDEISKAEPIHDGSAENAVIAAEVKNAAENVVAPPLDNGKINHSDEKAVLAQKPKDPVAETAAPQLDGAKKTYAAMVESMARNAAPFQVKAPVQKPKHMGQPRASAAAPRAPAAAAPRAPAAVGKSEKKNDQKIVEEPGTSIFVSNLPMDAVPPQIHELFKGFGPIKENGIQVRSNRSSGICYGFVAFESATSVQSVLQAAKNNPFKLAERNLRVKEKQVDYDGRKPSGGRSGGGSKTQNGSADGGDELRRNRNRRNGGRNERRGDRNANGDGNQKSSEGGAAAPEVQA